ncbi:hypothetical protein E3983_01080 [Legionella israelensis]|uniref:Type IV secretion protein IcmL n=1 Tax=Legionella israelensis TaxID=454 RepID=A0AAX1EDM2_9GAMM|nr:DotI/IcmL/TraM family protein [Legionella israelensis]QBR83072.1 hypothetical protein E3983_01080 [Legionella israelensis]
MRAPSFILSFTLMLMLISPLSMADDNTEVKAWVENVLISTLAISYQESDEDIRKVQRYYSMNAWDGLSSFLGDKVDVVREKQLELHPSPQAPPNILETGYVSGIHYWRIAQDIIIPELDVEINFIVVVLEAKPMDGSRFVIQSISMSKNKSQ